jgi:hypothetical protein
LETVAQWRSRSGQLKSTVRPIFRKGIRRRFIQASPVFGVRRRRGDFGFREEHRTVLRDDAQRVNRLRLAVILLRDEFA